MKEFKVESRNMKLFEEFQVFIRRMLFNRPDIQKFLRFPYGQSTQPSIGFKTSAQGFKILSKAIQTIDWNYEVLIESLGWTFAI